MKDTLIIKLGFIKKKLVKQIPATKHSILKITARIYDPQGLVIL